MDASVEWQRSVRSAGDGGVGAGKVDMMIRRRYRNLAYLFACLCVYIYVCWPARTCQVAIELSSVALTSCHNL